MTIQEMGAIMDVLTAAYPQYYKNVPEDEKFKASCLWAEMFADDPVKIVAAVVKAFISTDGKGFPPTIGQIKSYITRLTAGQEKSEMEAWAEVKKALRNSSYGAQEEFERLEPCIQRIVGTPAQLREWACMETDVLDSVVASNFRSSYKAVAKNHREYLAMPESVKSFLSEVAGGMSLAALTSGEETA